MAIFQKERVATGITDQMTVDGWQFHASLDICERTGNAAAIHCGRILYFEMQCDGEIIAYFCGGIWYQTPSPAFIEGRLARKLFIEKWNKPKGDIFEHECGIEMQ